MAEQAQLKKRSTGLVAAAGLLIMVSFAAGYLTGFKRSESSKAAAIESTKKEIQNDLARTGLVPPTPEIKQIQAVVVSVGADSIEVDASQTVVNPLEDPAPTRRRILINTETAVVKADAKPLVQLNKERAAFQKEQEKALAGMEAGQQIPTIPSPSPDIISTIELSSLKAGDVVQITAAENIARTPEFTASEIRLVTQPPQIPGGDASTVERGAAEVAPPGLQPPLLPPVADPLR